MRMKKSLILAVISIVLILLGGNYYFSAMHEKKLEDFLTLKHIPQIHKHVKVKFDSAEFKGFWFWDKKFSFQGIRLVSRVQNQTVYIGSLEGDSNLLQGEIFIISKDGLSLNAKPFFNFAISPNSTWNITLNKTGLDLLNINLRNLQENHDIISSINYKIQGISIDYLKIKNALESGEIIFRYNRVPKGTNEVYSNIELQSNKFDIKSSFLNKVMHPKNTYMKEMKNSFPPIISINSDIKFSVEHLANEPLLNNGALPSNFKCTIANSNLKIQDIAMHFFGNFAVKDDISNGDISLDVVNNLSVTNTELDNYLKSIANSSQDNKYQMTLNIANNEAYIKDKLVYDVIETLKGIFNAP